MIKVLFVCKGNICRSPLAKGIAQHYIKRYNLQDKIEVDSAGLVEAHVGQIPDSRSIKVAKDNDVVLRHTARILSQEDLDSDIILVMDRSNYDIIQEIVKGSGANTHIQLVREYDPKRDTLDVRDPYYGNLTDFIITYEILDRSIKKFFSQLKAS